MPFDFDQKFKMVDVSGRQTPDVHTWKDHSMDLWAPLIIRKEEIDAEVERLASLPRPNNGVRRTQFVHPQCEEGLKSFAPGIGLSLDVLLPGERTQRVRTNSSIVNFPIKGSGSMIVGDKRFEFSQYDVLTTPSMAVHEYVNDTKEIQVRLRYDNAPLLERLKIHWLDENPPEHTDDVHDAMAEYEAKGKELPQSPFGTFQLTDDGAWLMPYEKLITPEPISITPHQWPWRQVKTELDKLAALGASYKGRRLYLLWDPATGRTNGTNPNFFSAITIRPQGIVDRPHRHASAAINYYFGGEGHSVVQGQRLDWKAGDLMFSAPGWAIHNHATDVGPVYEMTIQDMPFCINTDALLWQEDLKGPISLLGSHAGFETNRTKVA